MKKLLALIFIIASVQSFGQVKISDLLTYSGDPSGSWIPVVINGMNRKIDASILGYSKVDSIWVAGDSLKVKKNSRTISFAIPKTDPDGNNYPASAVFSNNTLTINRTGLSPLTVGVPLKDSSDALRSAVNAKQNILVSGANIKTINGSPVLGSGDITISGTDTNQVKDIVQKKIDGTRRWAKSGTGGKVTADNDTLVFSVIDYPSLLKSSIDPSYYFPLYTITSTQGTDQVPNVTGIKDSILIVSGASGQRILTISKGTQSIFNGQTFPLVIYHKAANRYEPYYAYSVGNGQIKLSTPLKYAAVADTLHTVHDDYLGQHLTTYAARAWADHLYDFPKGYALKNNFYIFQPELNPSSTPFTDVGAIQRGGFIAGTTDLPYLGEIILRNVIPPQLAKYFYAIYQKGAGRGVKWDVDLGGKTGYLEANIGLHRIPFTKTGGGTDTTRGIARVTVTIDGHVDSVDVRAYDNQILRFPFTKASSGQIKIVTGDTNVTAIVVNRIGWYNGAVDTSSKIDLSGKVVVLGDSWTQFQNGAQDFTERLKARGATNIVNNGRSGMTSEWGRYWFQQLVINEHPSACIIEFFTNDQNSRNVPSAFNFSSTGPFAAGTDVSGATTPTRWKENIDWMIEQCIANGIQPIIQTPAYGHFILSDYLSQLATNKYYEVKALTSSVVNVDNAVTSKSMITDSVATRRISVTDTVWVGKPEIGGSGIIMSKEVPSGSSGGVVVGFPTQHLGGDAFVVINGTDTLFRVNTFGKQAYSKYGLNTNGARITMMGLDITGVGRNPENFLHARDGSIAIDTSTGTGTAGIYHKTKTGTDSTGWEKMATVDTVSALVNTANSNKVTLSKYQTDSTATASQIAANTSAISANTTAISNNTTAINTKLGIETATTFAAISTTRTDVRLVYVVADETASNAATVYLYNGTTKIGQLLLY